MFLSHRPVRLRLLIYGCDDLSVCDDPETSPPGDSEGNDAPPSALEQLRELAETRRAVEDRRRSLITEARLLLREAHERGHSWQEIAEAAGLSNANAAKSLAAKKSELPEPVTAADPPDGTYSVPEAAAELGVTKQTIYKWIQAGQIRVADDRPRRLRVFLPPPASGTQTQ